MTKPIDQSQSKDTASRLVDAAADLISIEGWAALSTRSVADRAGVNKALVHYHFGSIDAVAVAALEQAMAAEMGEAVEVVLGPDQLDQGLIDFGVWLASRGDSALRRRIIVEGLCQATLREDVRSLLLGALNGLRAELVARLPDSIGDRQAIASMIAAALDGIVIHALIDPALDPAPLTRALANSIRSLQTQAVQS